MSTTVSPCQVISSRPVPVTSPMTVAWTPHLAQTPRKRSTLAGVTTAIIRSWDSLMRISGGPSEESRSGTWSSRTRMPPVPAAASSVVAQATPAAPRSWMPVIRSSRYSSRQHSMSSFSRNGSPTWTLGRLAAAPSPNVALASTEAPPMPSGPVREPSRMTWLPGPLAADVGQAQAVAVEGDAADHAGQHPAGVGGVGRAEPQRVHDRHRPGPHGQDVADDAADPGGRALMGLHVGRVVVGLDLERDRVTVADVDHPGVGPDPGQHGGAGGGLLAELAQVHLGRLVGAVLAPHHRVQGQLGVGGTPAEQVPDPLVLGLGQAQLGERLRLVRGTRRPVHRVLPCRVLRCCVLTGHRVLHRHRATSVRSETAEAKKPSPSVPGPVSPSVAYSGCGISPTTVPASLLTPAMSLTEPLGLAR